MERRYERRIERGAKWWSQWREEADVFCAAVNREYAAKLVARRFPTEYPKRPHVFTPLVDELEALVAENQCETFAELCRLSTNSFTRFATNVLVVARARLEIERTRVDLNELGTMMAAYRERLARARTASHLNVHARFATANVRETADDPNCGSTTPPHTDHSAHTRTHSLDTIERKRPDRLETPASTGSTTDTEDVKTPARTRTRAPGRRPRHGGATRRPTPNRRSRRRPQTTLTNPAMTSRSSTRTSSPSRSATRSPTTRRPTTRNLNCYSEPTRATGPPARPTRRSGRRRSTGWFIAHQLAKSKDPEPSAKMSSGP